MSLGARLTDLVRTRGRSIKHMLQPGVSDRIVIFESDDWGSQRIPSREARDWLVRKGHISGDGPYDSETLESAEDLEALCEVLDSVRDRDGRPARFTCYTNPANPDFEQIREDGFERYSFEPVSRTLERRGDREGVQAAWESGMERGLLCVEYHGREHLQARMWMEALKKPGPARDAFEVGCYSVKVPSAHPVAGNLRAAYFFESKSELPALETILAEGVDLLRAEFGVRPRAFCPPNNVFHPALFASLKAAGCDLIVRPLRRKEPDGRGGGRRRLRLSGGLGASGLSPIRRNGVFEPRMGFGVDHALRAIDSAFRWGVPAVIATHRVNYIGGIDPNVRAEGLRQLSRLLTEVVRLWPDSRFAVSSTFSARRHDHLSESGVS